MAAVFRTVRAHRSAPSFRRDGGIRINCVLSRAAGAVPRRQTGLKIGTALPMK